MAKYSLDDLITFALGLFAFSVIFSVTAVEAALFLTLILLLAKKYREQTLSDLLPSLTRHTLFAPWLIYLAVCLITALAAYYPAKALGQLNSDFLKYLCLATLLLAVKKEHLPRLSAAYTAGAVIAALVGITEVFRSIISGDTDVVRANAFMNAVRYGEVMGIAFTLALSQAILPQKESFRHEGLYYKAAAILLFAAVLLSQTRGAYLGTAAAIIFALAFSRASVKKVFTYGLALLTITAFLAALNPSIRQRFSKATPAPERQVAVQPEVRTYSSVNIRLELWQLGWKMFKAHPVLGVGPDNVKKVFKKFHPDPIGYEETWGSLHNLYIHQAAERGLLGLGTLLLLFAAFFMFALGKFRATASPYALWALCVLPAYYAMNLTEISFQHVHTAFAIFMALAFAAAEKAGSGN